MPLSDISSPDISDMSIKTLILGVRDLADRRVQRAAIPKVSTFLFTTKMPQVEFTEKKDMPLILGIKGYPARPAWRLVHSMSDFGVRSYGSQFPYGRT